MKVAVRASESVASADSVKGNLLLVHTLKYFTILLMNRIIMVIIIDQRTKIEDRFNK